MALESGSSLGRKRQILPKDPSLPNPTLGKLLIDRQTDRQTAKAQSSHESGLYRLEQSNVHVPGNRHLATSAAALRL